MTKFLRAFAAVLALLMLAAPGIGQAAAVNWNKPVPPLVAAPAGDGSFKLAFARGRHMKGGPAVGGGGTWNGTTIDCHGVPYKPGVIAAGVQAAWDTVCTAGPRVSSWNAAPSTGGNFTNGGVDIDVNGGTNTLNAPSFWGYRLWVFNSATLTLNDPQFFCNGNSSCIGGDIFRLGQDSGATPHGAGNLTVNYGDFNGIGRDENLNHSVLVDQASTLTTNHMRWMNCATDCVIVADGFFYSNYDFFGAFCTGTTLTISTHCEGTIVFGQRAEFHYTRMDSSVGNPFYGGYTSEVYFRPFPGYDQVGVMDHCVVNTDGTKPYPIDMGGDGTIDLTISYCALKKGNTGHYIEGGTATGVAFHDGGHNYDLDTGDLICGVDQFNSCFAALFVFYRPRRRTANDNDAPAARKIAA